MTSTCEDDIFDLPVHPAADVFPMLPADDLAELAADIKVNGLIHPLIVKDGVLIDGRNRREACRIVGVTPTVMELNGVDPVAYILSSNINRRHMTKGQRAMVIAKIYPEGEQGKRDAATSSVSDDVSATRIKMARTVLRYLPAMADAVIAGTEMLDNAYKQARDEKARNESRESRIARIAEKAPELVALITEQTLSIEAAEAEVRARDEQERARIAGLNASLADGLRGLHVLSLPGNDNAIRYLLDQQKVVAEERTLTIGSDPLEIKRKIAAAITKIGRRLDGGE